MAAQITLLVALVTVPQGPGWPVGVLAWVVGGMVSVGDLIVMIVAGFGLGRGLTPSPLPNAAAQLRTGGLYAWVRHPIYSGLLLLGAGIVAVSGSVARAGVFVLLVVLLTAKARWLAERFPGYRAYAAVTPRFVPDLRRPARPRRRVVEPDNRSRFARRRPSVRKGHGSTEDRCAVLGGRHQGWVPSTRAIQN